MTPLPLDSILLADYRDALSALVASTLAAARADLAHARDERRRGDRQAARFWLWSAKQRRDEAARVADLIEAADRGALIVPGELRQEAYIVIAREAA